jgi:hypothetical protein
MQKLELVHETLNSLDSYDPAGALGTVLTVHELPPKLSITVEVSVLPTPTQKVELTHETLWNSLSCDAPGFWLAVTFHVESAPAGPGDKRTPAHAIAPMSAVAASSRTGDAPFADDLT